jgi:hypothetical protein
VVRHPREGINPLDLIGRQNDSVDYLGPLNLLITNPPGALPAIHPDNEGVKAGEMHSLGKTSPRQKVSPTEHALVSAELQIGCGLVAR